jgi:dTDP-4-amino-4,6-dideoxygalactose transaminase
MSVAGAVTGPPRGRSGGPPPVVIALNDLRPQHREIADEVREGWERVCRSGRFVLGEEVERFEEAFARYCGRRHCVSVANGTDALELALRALGIGRGDTVAVPANSFAASAFAAVRGGAAVAFADVDEASGLATGEALAAALGGRRGALMPVHLYGQPAPADAPPPAGVPVVEDAAQAHGASRHGRRAGALGDVAAFSFHPSKNLGAYGDGGAVVTDDGDLADAVRVRRSHGERAKYDHAEVAGNSRLDELQAVVLSAKLARLDRWNRLRREAAAVYTRLLAGLDEVVTPAVLPGNEHVWHLYTVQVPHRDLVLNALLRAGVQAGMHYPRPIHLQRPFTALGHREGQFPAAERRARRLLTLPLYPGITQGQQELVVAQLRRALRAVERGRFK